MVAGIKALVVALTVVVVMVLAVPIMLATSRLNVRDYITYLELREYVVYAAADDNLQTLYENSSQPTLTLTSSNGRLSVRDSNDGIGTTLFEVQNNARTTSYLSVSASNITSSVALTVEGIGDGRLSSYDLNIGNTVTPSYGMIRFGDAVIGRTSYNIANVDLDGTVIFRNLGGPETGIIEFLWEEGSGATRFAIPSSGPGNATYNPRSMLIAGPAPYDTDMVTVGYWQTNNNIFDNLAADTAGDGADLGVQNDLEVEGDFFIDSIMESTTGANITFGHNINITSLPIYANNAAAVAGGLAVGTFYRTGNDPDSVSVVH